MAAQTGIEWCDSTVNPWIGCTRVSPACDDCYAARSTPARTMGIVWGPGETRRRTAAATWKQPQRWNDAHAEFFAQHGRRRRVFCASLADVFDNEVPPLWRAELFELIDKTPNLDWLLLTKRIGNAWKLMADARGISMASLKLPMPNVWLGATVVDQAEADRDIPKLLATPAAVRFLSIEPMLGPIDLDVIQVGGGDFEIYPLRGTTECTDWDGEPIADIPHLDWIIAGGESGPKARPSHPDWYRSLRDQCAAAGTPFLFKQWGEWREQDESGLPGVRTIHEGDPEWADQAAKCDAFMSIDGELIVDIEAGRDGVGYRGLERIGKKAAGRLLDGVEHNGFPEVRHAGG